MTPDAHMVETLRLRTAALHRVSRSNDLLRRENDDLRGKLTHAESLWPDVVRFAAKHSASLHTAARDPRAPSFADDWCSLLDALRAALDGTP